MLSFALLAYRPPVLASVSASVSVTTSGQGPSILG